MIRRALLLAFLLFWIALPVHGQEVSARVLVDPAGPVTVGDPLALTIEVIHPDDTLAILPDLGERWGDFEIQQSFAPEVHVNEGGGLTTRRSYQAALFAPGDFDTPPASVFVSDRTGVTLQAVASPVSVNVASVLGEGDTQPRDIKPQATLRMGWVTPQLAGGLLGLLVAGGGGWLLWKRIRAGGLLGRTPLQRVLDELNGIAAANYPAQNRYKELYLAVTHSVRRHAEREFHVDLRERTTSELRTLLRTLPLHPEVARRLLTLFAESDLVKFAQVTPTPESAAALLGEARAVAQQLSEARAAAESSRASDGAPAPTPVRR